MSSLATVQFEESSSATRSIKYRLKHQHVIDDFSILLTGQEKEAEPSYPYILSVPFSPSQDSRLQFCLLVYSKGDREESKDYIGVYLQAVFTEDVTVSVKYGISIPGSQYKTEAIDTFKPKTIWGKSKFVAREHILNSTKELLPGDKLTVNCELEILAKRTTDSTGSSSGKEAMSLAMEKTMKNYETLLESGEMSDVVLVVEGKNLPAHKAILAAHSSVLKAMFQVEMKEKSESRVEVSDIKVVIFEEILRFMYTCQVPEVDKYAEELLAAAEKYDIGALKHICEKNLCDKVFTSTAAHLLYIADLNGASQLKAVCLDFIRRNIFDVMLTEDWNKVAILLGEEMRQLEARKNPPTGNKKKK